MDHKTPTDFLKSLFKFLDHRKRRKPAKKLYKLNYDPNGFLGEKCSDHFFGASG
jgi:hypothetical protein